MRHGRSDGYPDDDGGVVGLTENFKCATCGKVHQRLPRSFAADFPDMYANMKREEKDGLPSLVSLQPIIPVFHTFPTARRLLLYSPGRVPPS
jgi:hypothetical protein